MKSKEITNEACRRHDEKKAKKQQKKKGTLHCHGPPTQAYAPLTALNFIYFIDLLLLFFGGAFFCLHFFAEFMFRVYAKK